VLAEMVAVSSRLTKVSIGVATGKTFGSLLVAEGLSKKKEKS